MRDKVADGRGDGDLPLVVDLDGTFLRSDLLVEGALNLVKTRPIQLISALTAWSRKGRAGLKASIAATADLDSTSLPVTEELLAFLQQERAAGRRIYLASAADQSHVAEICRHYDLFDGFFASDGMTNLSGQTKADRLIREFGERGFDYAGNAAEDLPVWAAARRVIAVNATAGVLRMVQDRFPEATVLSPQEAGWGASLQALRPYQWAKNCLLFLPMLTAHVISVQAVGLLLVAFLAFGLVASAVYLINDMLDLEADRDHMRKRFRPMASGAVPIVRMMGLVPVLLGGGAVLAAGVSGAFLAVLAGYFALTVLYSVWLKQKPVIDVMTLAGLYTVRVIAGAVVLGVPLSAWLLAFSLFLFMSLALVKRLAELHGRQKDRLTAPLGRGYTLDDLPLLRSLAVVSGYAAVLVLALYVNSPAVVGLYAVPEGLWLICVLFLYWISRVLLLTHRGQMHDDPVIFAMRDVTSLGVFGLSVLIVIGCALR